MKFKVGDIVRFVKNCTLSTEDTIHVDSVWKVKEVIDSHYELTHKDKHLRDIVIMIEHYLVDDCCEKINTEPSITKRIDNESDAINGLTMTEREEFDRDDLEHLMVLLSEFDCVYNLNNADKEAINKAIDVVGRECEMRRRLENW